MSVENNTVEIPRRSVRFYAMGGTGINITNKYRSRLAKEFESLKATEHFSFFDTSVANLHGIGKDMVYLCEDSQGKETDGSGSDRGGNAALINENIKPFIMKHPPAALNVVVFGASGGTGSTASPLLIDHLLAAGESVVAVITMDINSPHASQNAYRTHLGLERAAERLGKDIVFAYAITDSSNGKGHEDLYQLNVLSAISILASGRNARIDGADVRNLFRPSLTTGAEPSIHLLEVFETERDHQEIETGKYLSSVMVLRGEDDRHPAADSIVAKTGYLRDTLTEPATGYFFGVGVDSLNRKVITRLESLNKEVGEIKAVTAKVKRISSEAQDSGIGNLIF